MNKNVYKKSGGAKKNSNARVAVFLALALLIMAGVAVAIMLNTENGGPSKFSADKTALEIFEQTASPNWVTVDFIDVDGASRRGEKLEDLTAVAVHYVANPGTSAQQNRSYFTNADSSVSSHFVIGLDGEIIQCLPLDEKSSATNERNRDTISIEVCHPDESGKFNDKTYTSLVKLTAWLCQTGRFDEEGIIRHYDVTGKLCPKYYVENEDEWLKFKSDVMQLVN